MNKSCDALGYSGVPNPTSEELDGILDAIAAESKESGLDQRFILAIMVSTLAWHEHEGEIKLTFRADARIKGLCESKVHSIAWR